ncbi:MAG TPA: histidine kinase [Candidatus Methylomirabilis sp.]|nr:histidine kinase [Candidatus Methylomirabilis sp.]
MDGPTLRRVCRSPWARAAAVSLVVAVVITGMFGVVGAPIAATFQRALTHSLVITCLATWVLSRVMPGLRAASAAVRWAALIPILLGVSVAGTALSCGARTIIDGGHWLGLAACAISSLTVNALLTATIGIAMVLYEGQRDRLDALTLDLRTRQLEHERANTMALETRLATLEARLHPHFLFNTLNAISALIREDPEEAERTVERLAALLRFSLDATQRGLVPLGDELKIVVDYLEIERTRLGERLSYALKVAPALTGWLIPPLAIQTLVENCVKHAVAPRPEGGHIRVEASGRGDGLVIGVWDDGPGFSADAMTPGHGLDNLRGRLAARFGSAGTLGTAREDGGCLVTLTVPRLGTGGA